MLNSILDRIIDVAVDALDRQQKDDGHTIRLGLNDPPGGSPATENHADNTDRARNRLKWAASGAFVMTGLYALGDTVQHGYPSYFGYAIMLVFLCSRSRCGFSRDHDLITSMFTAFSSGSVPF